MWALISTSSNLKFFDLKSKESKEIEGLNYFIKQKGYAPEVLFDHDTAVKTLLKNGVPLFSKKEEAKKEAVALNLAGFKYLKLTPNYIQI